MSSVVRLVLVWCDILIEFISNIRTGFLDPDSCVKREMTSNETMTPSFAISILATSLANCEEFKTE